MGELELFLKDFKLCRMCLVPLIGADSGGPPNKYVLLSSI